MTPKGANCEEGSRDFEEGVGQLQGEARRFNLSEENVGGGRTMRVIQVGSLEGADVEVS